MNSKMEKRREGKSFKYSQRKTKSNVPKRIQFDTIQYENCFSLFQKHKNRRKILLAVAASEFVVYLQGYVLKSIHKPTYIEFRYIYICYIYVDIDMYMKSFQL